MATSTSGAPEPAGAADLSAGVAWIEGEFVPIGEARIPIVDFGFTRSDTTYDVVGVWKERFFRLDDHLDRLYAGLEKLRLELPVDRDGLVRILAECVRRAGLEDAYVETIATRGIPPPGSRDLRLCVNRLYCFAIPYVWLATPDQRERGLRLAVGEFDRISPGSVDPTVKNFHWLDFQRSLLAAYERGADTVVLTDGEGHLAEGAGFNVFVVQDGVVYTPARGALEGITRRTVIDIAHETGIPLEVGPVPISALATADEVFGSSTAGGILWCSSVDGTQVGAGAMGPVTARVNDTYWAWHDDPRFTLALADVPSPNAP